MDLNRIWSGKLDKHFTQAMDLDNTFPWTTGVQAMVRQPVVT